MPTMRVPLGLDRLRSFPTHGDILRVGLSLSESHIRDLGVASLSIEPAFGQLATVTPPDVNVSEEPLVALNRSLGTRMRISFSPYRRAGPAGKCFCAAAGNAKTRKQCDVIGECTLAEERAVTAALLVIGDEILLGRTKDQNIGASSSI